MNDAYAWIVTYRDGSTLSQIAPERADLGWAAVDHDQVACITLLPQRDGLPAHGVKIPDDARAWLTWRRTVQFDPNTGEQFTHPALLIAGWERAGASAYLFVDELGNALVGSTRDAI